LPFTQAISNNDQQNWTTPFQPESIPMACPGLVELATKLDWIVLEYVSLQQSEIKKT
jgi:hypothetical protein